ncbi:hypothetical protein NUW58_g10903 [Xylaria curta]|uniref:Uncharacterized protein n=1 Tax=Xylaria curta TaxID=42375 RepID=A0ACC1MGF3_9PEZI|nr:hypothetical protein NUW58_g10903 [Xylaria curta]
MVHGTADKATSFEQSRAWFERNRANIPDARFKAFEGWAHQLHADPGKEEFYEDVAAWILERLDAAADDKAPGKTLSAHFARKLPCNPDKMPKLKAENNPKFTAPIANQPSQLEIHNTFTLQQLFFNRFKLSLCIFPPAAAILSQGSETPSSRP